MAMKYQEENRSAEVNMPMMLKTAIISISTMASLAELKSRQSHLIDFKNKP
jgi:hypothetical protein